MSTVSVEGRPASKKRSAVIAWALCAIAVLGILAEIVVDLQSPLALGTNSAFFDDLTFAPFLIISAVVGALIISRHPKNIIGWLLMFYPVILPLLSPLDFLIPKGIRGDQLTVPQFLIIWVDGWGWWLLIGPLFLILLLFPTGSLPSRRWRWALIAMAVCFVTFLVLSTLSPTLEFNQAEIKNPVGAIPAETYQTFLLVFQALLLITVVSCVASIFARYRRAPAEMREQIKWFLYACTLFLAVYLVTGFVLGDNPGVGLLFNFVIVGIPLAIGIAILRYHLFDIDLIINRTLVYVPLTAILAGFYSATVSLTQKFLVATTGEKSDTAVIMTTFLLVALFTPVKNLLQGAVDRRFKEPATQLKEISALEKQVKTVMEVLDGNLITRRLLSTSVDALHASGGAVYLSHAGDLRLVHATSGWAETNRRASFPLKWNGRQLGMLYLGPRKSGGDYSAAEQQAIQQAADQVARAVVSSMGASEEV